MRSSRFKYTIEYFSGAWFFDDVEDTLDDAKYSADQSHERTGDCYRVVDNKTESEVYRTDGVSDFTNR